MSGIIGGNMGMFSHPNLPKLDAVNCNGESNKSLQFAPESVNKDTVSIGKDFAEPALSFKYNTPIEKASQPEIAKRANLFSEAFFNLNTIDSIAKNGIFTISGNIY